MRRQFDPKGPHERRNDQHQFGEGEWRPDTGSRTGAKRHVGKARRRRCPGQETRRIEALRRQPAGGILSERAPYNNRRC